MAMILYCEIPECKRRISPSEPVTSFGEMIICEKCAKTKLVSTGSKPDHFTIIQTTGGKPIDLLGAAHLLLPNWKYYEPNKSNLGDNWYRIKKTGNMDGPVHQTFHRFWNGQSPYSASNSNSCILQIPPAHADSATMWRYNTTDFFLFTVDNVASLEKHIKFWAKEIGA